MSIWTKWHRGKYNPNFRLGWRFFAVSDCLKSGAYGHHQILSFPGDALLALHSSHLQLPSVWSSFNWKASIYCRGAKLNLIPGHISFRAALKGPIVTVNCMYWPMRPYRQKRQLRRAALWQGQENVGQKKGWTTKYIFANLHVDLWWGSCVIDSACCGASSTQFTTVPYTANKRI